MANTPRPAIESSFQNQKQFESPEHEIAFLREELSRRQESATEQGTGKRREQIADELTQQYKQEPVEETVAPNLQHSTEEIQGITLDLAPEQHDNKMAELMGILQERGIKSAMQIVDAMDDPHIDDDFHRFLVGYIASGHEVVGLSKNREMYNALHMTLFEVTLPAPDDEEKKTFKELISIMEQFYAGMQSVAHVDDVHANSFSVEISLSDRTDEVVFYVAVPNNKKDLFEKQILGIYDRASIIPVTNDYNIFAEGGQQAGSYAKSSEYEILSLKNFDEFESDPLQVIINAFSKLKTIGEGASVQLVISPTDGRYIKQYGRVLDRIRKGEKLKLAMQELDGAGKQIAREAWKMFTTSSKPDTENKEEKDKSEERIVNDDVVESITKKLQSSIAQVNIRVVASAQTHERARDIVHDVQSSFNQFTSATGTGLSWEHLINNKLDTLLHDYSYRIFRPKQAMRLNLRELATILHFPAATSATPQLRQAKVGGSSAPMNMSQDGILLGYNNYRGKVVEARISPEDRLRHFYVIGQTGTGKTGIFMNMIAQDIANGEGVCYIDPHGSDVQRILSFIPPERYEDVIYFDPANMERPMALNMLEYDVARPEQKTFVVNELMAIFNQLFDMKNAGGPMFEQYFRNSAFLVMEDPESGNTLMEISRVLSDKEFRDYKLSKSTNPLIKQFWANAEKTQGEQGLENFVPYITSKFDGFLSNDIMRPIITQEKSSFDFRDIMDNKKILLVNLALGKLGKINSDLIGLLLVGKIQMAALSRVDSFGKNLPPFYLYIDEFQNVTTPSIASILSEARKYGLSLNAAHQYMEQLTDDIRGAVLGNVGSMAIFRISPEDAEKLEDRVAPTFTASDITKLENRHAYMSMLVNGEPVKPFNIRTPDFPAGVPDQVEKLKELSRLKYGRPRDQVEQEILKKFNAS
ncbi:MAG: TraM recognition domain-containing protein [Candidatus Nomurabacteria bacterium]|nr:TraM recognition domain-containing protein [Candidatus Nomurabacteria bacterium]